MDLSHGFDSKSYLICSLFSIVLMILFVFVNYTYYKNISGNRVTKTLVRTISINTVAILIGWGPVTYLWPKFSITILLPFVCLIGAIGCVGSRFVYPEIVPEALAQKITEHIEAKLVSKEKREAGSLKDSE